MPEKKLVMAVDPSAHNCGVAVYTYSPLTLRTSFCHPLAHSLKRISLWLTIPAWKAVEVYDASNEFDVIIERVAVGPGADAETVHAMNMVFEVCKDFVPEHKIHLISPGEWKPVIQALTLKGRIKAPCQGNEHIRDCKNMVMYWRLKNGLKL